MTALDLFDRLRRADVRVWVEDGRLRASAPSGVLTSELRQQLAEHREALQALLERTADADHEPVTTVPRGPGQTFPLSFTQQRLWMLHALNPDAAAYHVVQADRIRGALNVPALHDAWSAVTRRHEMLRARVVVVDGGPMLTIDEDATAVVRDVNLAEGDGAAGIDRLIQAEATRPFDLERGPLASMLVARVAADEHVVVIRLHHIVSDQWSLGILREDLFALYREAVQGIPAALPELLVQYVDYASWQHEQVSSPAWDEARAYWRKTLAGAEPTELPSLDTPTPGSPEGGRVCVSLPASLLQGLTTLAGHAGGTLFMAFIAGFAATLARYTGQEDLMIGTPVAGRQRAEFERLVGPFINTLALRVVIPGSGSFLDLLRHVRDVTLAAQAHQDLPFEQVVAIAAPARRPGRPPLVQVMFNLLNTPPAGVVLPGLEGESLTVDRQSSALDLTLIADMSDGTLTAEFRLEVIAEAGARQFVTHFLRLLTAAVADPTVPVVALPILDAGERAWITRVNDTSRPLADERLSSARLRGLAASRPDRTAVVCGAERLTYDDLARRRAALAARLRAEGVGPNVLVGVSLRRSVHVAVALLAILDSGGAYLPIDPALPGARRTWLIQDGRPQLILADDVGAAALGTIGVPILRIDRLPLAEPPAETAPVEPAAGAEDLAYVLYTSGSTGQPKGVEISRRALSNFLDSMADTPGVGAEDVLVAVTTLSFDIATLEILLPLRVGATLVIATTDQVTDGHRLLALVRECHATVMQGTPATWQMLLEAGWDGSPAMKVLCGGEALTRDLADRLLERSTSVWNLYGPTETTIWSTVDRVTSRDAITIGRPIANTSVYVLDASRDLVPVGVAGELYIGGAGVARGYRGRPDLTAGRFLPDSFAGRSGARMYRTGDLARCRPDGRIDYLGRIDRQLKLRGFRIEPAEIETALAEHEEIRQAVVVLRQDAGEPMLVAYVTRRPGATGVHVEEGSLRAGLRARLPVYMVPARVVFLDQLPLTPSGKIDHRALPPPGEPAGGSGRPMAPATATEISLAAVWRRVLKVDRVDLRDDFFAAGGHSLLAMRLVADVAESLDVHLSPGAIFEYPVFEDLARHIDERRWAGSDRPWSIVQLAEGAASESPFFWFHGIGGEVFSYVELSKHLGRSRPVYGVAADWSRARTNGPLTVQQIAAEYVREVVRIDPSGPYLLGGYCAGALLAVEVARLLRSRGARVALVVVVDYRLDLGVRPGWAGLTLAFLRNLPRWLLQDALPSGAPDLAGRIRSAVHRIRARIARPAAHHALDIRDRLGVWRFPSSQLALLQVHSEVFGTYEVPGLDADVALFVPETAPLFGPWPAHDDRRWLERSHNRLRTYPVRGSHSTILREPFATGLAARIERSVDEALANQSVV